jgi:hypothetical protein
MIGKELFATRPIMEENKFHKTSKETLAAFRVEGQN